MRNTHLDPTGGGHLYKPPNAGTITGTLTPGAIPLASTASALGDSAITYSAGVFTLTGSLNCSGNFSAGTVTVSLGTCAFGDGSFGIVGTTAGTKLQFLCANMGFFSATPTTKQASGADLTNNVTSGGTSDIIADVTAASVDTSAAKLTDTRNAIYQLARKVKQVNDALRLYGLLT